MPRSEVATTERNLPDFANWVVALQTEAQLTEETDSDFDPAQIINGILASEDFDAAVALQDSGLQSGKSLVDVIHTIYGFEVRTSDQKYTNQNERSLGVYMVVTAADESGRDLIYGVGAANVMAILWKAREMGKLPMKAQIRSRETRNGDLLSLMPVKTAVSA